MREEIVYLKVDDLKNNPKNPRKNESAIDSVAKSIEKYGFRNPLIVDKDNVVWCGNTRLKASKKLGLKEVPCVVVKDLTEKQMMELALLDNKTNEIAEWDFDMLSDIIPTIDLEDFDLDWGIEKKENDKENGDVEFTEILNEENNYLVLVFKKDIDWLQAKTIFDIKEVKAFNTTKKESKIKRKGVGRVLDGSKVIERILENENIG